MTVYTRNGTEWRGWYSNDAETSYSKAHAFQNGSGIAICGTRFPYRKKESCWTGDNCERCENKLAKMRST